jgi:hypothetical protein
LTFNGKRIGGNAGQREVRKLVQTFSEGLKRRAEEVPPALHPFGLDS